MDLAPENRRRADADRLLPSELRAVLPKLYAPEREHDPTVYAKFCTPDSSWTWYVTDGQEEDGDFLFFGHVVGLEREWGYFALSGLESVRRPVRLPVERDLHLTPRRFTEVLGELL